MFVKNKATVNVSVGMFSYTVVISVVMVGIACKVAYIHIGVRLSRCSFRRTGQCESLDGWDEQQVQVLTLFLYI